MNLQNATEERLQHAQTLLHELEIFKRHLEKKKKYQVEYRHFQNDIKKELEALKSFQHIFKSYDGQTESPALEAAQHALKSSNLPFLEAVWEAAKRSSDVVSLKRHGQAIDAVAEGGLLWIKVFNMTERRLLFEMAEEGWEWVSWEEEHEETCIPKTRTNISHDDSKALGSSGPESGESNLTLLKVAESLVRLSKQTRVKHKHPQVLFILPRIYSSRSKDIDALLDRVRTMGITVTCANELTTTPQLEEVMDTMIPDKYRGFTETLNIDCTILLALVSDISHSQVAGAPWFNRALRRQIEIEANEQLLPSILWPALSDRKLVCSREAARRMREIVDMIGTETEKARTRILMGDDQTKSQPELVKEFQSFSEHQVPTNWQLPISMVVEDIPVLARLPAVAASVASQLSEINQSVFLYGWASGNTTISSNRTVTKLIETVIEEHRVCEDEKGPDVWLCPVARSLVAKEKERHCSS